MKLNVMFKRLHYGVRINVLLFVLLGYNVSVFLNLSPGEEGGTTFPYYVYYVHVCEGSYSEFAVVYSLYAEFQTEIYG
jgi:hypothetical protein